MEPIIISRVWTQGEFVQVEDLRGTAFTEEAGAHVFRIAGRTAQGAALPLAGTVLAKFLRADDVTVDVNGTITDGVISLKMAADCYHAPGRFSVVIYLSDGVDSVAVYAAVGKISRGTSGQELDSGAPVPSLVQLQAAYNSALAAAAYAEAAASKSVRYDTAQSLTDAQKSQARQNIGAVQISPTDSGGSATGMLIIY